MAANLMFYVKQCYITREQIKIMMLMCFEFDNQKKSTATKFQKDEEFKI